MKYKKIFCLLVFCFTLIIFSLNPNKENKNISINGTYQDSLSPFNTLVFDKETMKYYKYTCSEKFEGSFYEKSKNNYILETGELKGSEIIVGNKNIKVINNDTIEIYKKISHIPTLQDN